MSEMAPAEAAEAAAALGPAPGQAAPSLAFREPALFWCGLGFLATPFLGALAPALLFSAADLGERLGADGLGPRALAPLVNSLILFGGLGVLAAFLVGGPWFWLTRRRARSSRLGVALACGIIGVVFALIAPLVVVIAAAVAGLTSASGAGQTILGAAQFSLAAALAGSAIGLPSGLVAGFAFSLLAFRRNSS